MWWGLTAHSRKVWILHNKNCKGWGDIPTILGSCATTWTDPSPESCSIHKQQPASPIPPYHPHRSLYQLHGDSRKISNKTLNFHAWSLHIFLFWSTSTKQPETICSAAAMAMAKQCFLEPWNLSSLATCETVARGWPKDVDLVSLGVFVAVKEITLGTGIILKLLQAQPGERISSNVDGCQHQKLPTITHWA